jgi:hypothetical protein
MNQVLLSNALFITLNAPIIVVSGFLLKSNLTDVLIFQD